MATRASRATASPLTQVVRTIRKGGSFLVTAHPSPDGDAIGSMAAALLALEQLGKQVVAYNPDPVPRRFEFVSGTSRFTTLLPPGPFDVTLMLDCSDDRMFPPELDHAMLGRVVVVDHHQSRGGMGHVVLSDPGAAAVSVLLCHIFRRLKVELTRDMAEGLFCSLMSDTGSFRYQNTNPEAMQVAARLLEAGVDPWQVSSRLYEERPRHELDLLGQVLRTLEVSDDGLSASLTVTPEMLTRTGCTPDMVDGFINYARGVKGVEVAILLRPGPNHVRVSFRSRGTVDVARVAERFGGGGHRNAAGCTIDQDVQQIRDDLFAEVSRIVARAR